jgi:hypothetical protein
MAILTNYVSRVRGFALNDCLVGPVAMQSVLSYIIQPAELYIPQRLQLHAENVKTQYYMMHDALLLPFVKGRRPGARLPCQRAVDRSTSDMSWGDLYLEAVQFSLLANLLLDSSSSPYACSQNIHDGHKTGVRGKHGRSGETHKEACLGTYLLRFAALLRSAGAAELPSPESGKLSPPSAMALMAPSQHLGII